MVRAALALAILLGATIASASQVPALTPGDLAARLAPEAGWASQIAAAEAAASAQDPRLIPAMFAGFAAAKRGPLQEDPDIHERLLIGLEAFPPADVAAALKAAPVPPGVDASAADYHRWLDAVAADPRGFSMLRVVQGDALNAFLGDGSLPPAPDVPIPGGDAPTSAPGGDFTLSPAQLPPHPDAAWPWVTAGVIALLIGLVVLAGRRPGARPIVFRVLAVALAPLGLILLEGVLTLGGMEPLNAARPNFNLGGDRAGMRWFEPVHAGSDALHTVKNNARYDVFTAAKPADTLRIVALGGSSVRGKGDLVEYAWPSVLERRLRACGATVEVINAGADGAVSDDLAVVARNMSAYDPDLFVVYTGYNDFVFVPLLTRFEGYSPARMGLRYLLGRTRTAHLIARATGRLDAPSSSSAPSSTPAAPTDAEVADMRRLLATNLSHNLRRVARTARAAGADVIFVTQGQNEDLCGPGSLNGQVEWDRACFPAEARATVLQAASAEGVTVVDAAAALRVAGGDRPVGWSHFWDEIHPGRAGSAVIGEAVATTAAGVLGVHTEGCAQPLPAR